MSISEKNFQGFTILGLDFDSNYGEEISACCQFHFKGYEISASTGAESKSRGITRGHPQPILVTHIVGGKEHMINGSIEDAIQYCIENPA